MYFPYLIARGEEVEAIIATVCQFKDNKIIPVLEPYNEDEDELYKYNKLIKLVGSLIEANKSFVLLIDSEKDLQELKKSFKDLDNYCIHGYESGNVNYQSDKQNIAIIHRNQDSLVNDSSNLIYNIFMPEVLRFQTYINQYNQGKSVLVEDGFIKHEPNSDYPSHEDFNSELCFTYKNKNVLGFGDFTILENGYQPSGGGKADSVTHVIHLTKKETASTKDKIVVYHYLTTPSEEADNKRRSAKTIAKAYNSRTQFLYTSGIKLIEGKYPNGTSLGMYKRIGVAHHIELIHSLI